MLVLEIAPGIILAFIVLLLLVGLLEGTGGNGAPGPRGRAEIELEIWKTVWWNEGPVRLRNCVRAGEERAAERAVKQLVRKGVIQPVPLLTGGLGLLATPRRDKEAARLLVLVEQAGAPIPEAALVRQCDLHLR